jgi:TolB-like protein/Tfp pilus assembly protein PilF
MEGGPSKPASAPTGAVFLSYASEDAEAAERIATALRAAGIEVWFDKSELRGGDAWDRQIREEIHDCRLFIPVISANSERRDEGYFRREWRLAVERAGDMAHKKAFLVPVVVDRTSERGASVPEKFHELQWSRLPAGETPPAFVERVRQLMSPEPAPAPSNARSASPVAGAPPAARALTHRRRSRPALMALAFVVIAAGAYLAVDRFVLSRRSAPAAIADKSIAVLPFTDLSEKHDQGYFADGLAEETLAQLAKIPGLRVIGRTSSFQFKGKADDLGKIGTTLGTAYVLEGSVRRSMDLVRVTAQLLSTQDGIRRWSDTYDAKVDDVLRVQDSIAVGIARALELTAVKATTEKQSITSPEAYDLYLRGLQALDRASLEGCERAIDLFSQALQLNPSATQALISLAWAHDCIGWGGWLVQGAGYPQAREFATRALKIDPNLADAHLVLANASIVHDWDWAEAQREIDTAFKLAPPDARAFTIAARLAGALGQFEHAIDLSRQALVRDPLDPHAYDEVAGIYLRSDNYAEAETANRRCLQVAPDLVGAHYWLAIALLMQGRLQDAMAETERETPGDGKYLGGSVVLFAMHRYAESDTALKKAIELNRLDWPSGIARAYALRGEADQAMVWLERAYEARDQDLFFIKGDPQLRKLESDPRYKAFLRKMNLPEQ